MDHRKICHLSNSNSLLENQEECPQKLNGNELKI